jgi:hypothetical protein
MINAASAATHTRAMSASAVLFAAAYHDGRK